SAITRFFYDQNNVVEESQLIGAARQTTATYVWGGLESRLQPVTSPTIPAPPIRDVPPAEAGTPNLQLLSAHFGGSDYAYSSDDLGTALALSDPLGRVAERYEYGDFGQPTVATHSQGPNASALYSDAATNQIVADDFRFNRPARIIGLRWW